MYKAKLKLNNNEFEGTLTFETLKNIQRSLRKEFDRKLNVQEIFIALSSRDFEVISCFLIETIKSCNYDKSKEIKLSNRNYDDIESEIEELENIYKYINDILDECLPLNSSNNDSEFEDEFEDIIEDCKDCKDWEFGWMQYLWESVLKRNNFYNKTAKEFFEQLEIHKKANNVKDEEVEEL